jgi:hypothetical protein
MSDSNLFNPERITMVEFKMVKSRVDVPEDFDPANVEGHHLDNSLQLGFSLDEKLVKADFSIDIKTASKGQNVREAVGNFHLVFIYHVENLPDLAKPDHNKGTSKN